jgi:hypothetical protein
MSDWAHSIDANKLSAECAVNKQTIIRACSSRVLKINRSEIMKLLTYYDNVMFCFLPQCVMVLLSNGTVIGTDQFCFVKQLHDRLPTTTEKQREKRITSEFLWMSIIPHFSLTKQLKEFRLNSVPEDHTLSVRIV